VPDVFGTEWVGGFVGCTTGGTFQGRVGAGFSGATGGNEREVVFGAVLLCADGADRFLRFAEFGVVAITLTVTAVGVGGPRVVWCDAAFSVAESERSCGKAVEVDCAQEGDNKCGCLFVGAVICLDKPAGCLRKAQGRVGKFDLFLDHRWAMLID
jgi:hypothetical protein